MHLQSAFPTTLLCRLLDLSRSSFYYAAHPRADTALVPQLHHVSGTYPTYGILRLTEQVCRDYQVVNAKRVRRVARQMGLKPKTQRKTRYTTQSKHAFPHYPNLVMGLPITYPDQVGVGDITHVQLAFESVYLAILMDVFTRCIRSWHLSRSLDQTLTLTALQRALQTRCPKIHHSAQGLQYAAAGYGALLEAHHVQRSMAKAGAAWQNGYAERLIHTIKEEDDLEFDAMLSRILSWRAPGVALIDKGEFNRFTCDRLNLLRQLLNLFTILFVRQSDVQGQPMTQPIHHQMHFAAALTLGFILARTRPPPAWIAACGCR